MTTYLRIFILFMSFILTTPSVYAQHRKRIKRSNSMRFSFFDSTIDSLENNVMNDGFFYAGGVLMSHVNSLGRDNNINQWAIDPLAGFQKNNLDIYVNGFSWSQTTPKWAETDIGISKMWQLSKPLSIVSSYEHAFVNYGTDDDKYGLNNLISTQLNWTNKLFDTDLRYEYDWGHTCASILEFSIGRQFNFYDVFVKDKVEITPRFYVSNLGGNTYPVRFFNHNPACDANGVKPFQIANYEVELPFTWRKIGNVECNITCHLAVPQHVFPEEGSGHSIFYLTSSIVKIIPVHHRHQVLHKT